MKFFLEVDLPDSEEATGELVGILRDAADDLADLGDLEPGDKQDLFDTGNSRVGSWSIASDAE
jgi:hypothetical protein